MTTESPSTLDLDALEEKLLPCPFCGYRHPEFKFSKGSYIFCPKCETCGPLHKGIIDEAAQKAFRDWNVVTLYR